QCGTLSYTDLVGTVNIIEGNYGTTATMANAAAVNEGTDSEFVITLNQASCGDVIFEYSTNDGTAVSTQDYTAASSVAATIPAGQTLHTISIVTTDDDVYEAANETFTV